MAYALEPVVKGPELPEKYRLLGLAGVILSSKLVPGTVISLFSAGSSEFVEALPGYQQLKPMVFSGVYPVNSDEHTALRGALDRLR